MLKQQLINLAERGQLKEEPPAQVELQGLISSGRIRLQDSTTPGLSLESRFDLSYNAAHSLAQAALRWHGYRSENRITVFQCLAHTTQLSNSAIRLLVDAHARRNRSEYEGFVDLSDSLVDGLFRVTSELLLEVDKLGPPSTTA